ncbi:hypothetical protein D4764_13G0005360 [Takifugu flavidus]|uniref:Uncharacterized protein n=1 Tax=Takifugu flavidus TaxID=433684 RepID=A0A5C6P7T6_9TELE|nr:hypothetical protein D4764_13G0005360 [Takifugu flavidus]
MPQYFQSHSHKPYPIREKGDLGSSFFVFYLFEKTEKNSVRAAAASRASRCAPVWDGRVVAAGGGYVVTVGDFRLPPVGLGSGSESWEHRATVERLAALRHPTVNTGQERNANVVGTL